MSKKLNKILSRYKNIYFVGIKGVGMTALAVLLKEAGVMVSGSDVADIFQTDEILNNYRIQVKLGFKKDNLPSKTDLVIVSGAHGGMTNIEAMEAKKKGLAVMMHGQALGLFMDQFIGISVSGCHGKTTTSAMIATILQHGGLDPSFAIGCAKINPLGPAGHYGKGKYFVAEADEYMTCPVTDKTPRFFWQNPKIAVINNIEFDHPDAYSDIIQVRDAFITFSQKIHQGGLLVAGIDNDQVQILLKELKGRLPVATFGFSPSADYQVKNMRCFNQKIFFNIVYQKLILGEFSLNVPGFHNVLNATASFIVANFLGINLNLIKEGLGSFLGTKRRFERIVQVGNTFLYDDYAHHPTEIEATLKTAKDFFPGRNIIVIFQPHTYSRTKALFNEFVKAFYKIPNTTIITDIFASARELTDKSISSELLVQEILRYKKEVYYLPKKTDVLKFLAKRIKSQDVIFTIGAGDIYLWHEDIISLLKSKYG